MRCLVQGERVTGWPINLGLLTPTMHKWPLLCLVLATIHSSEHTLASTCKRTKADISMSRLSLHAPPAALGSERKTNSRAKPEPAHSGLPTIIDLQQHGLYLNGLLVKVDREPRVWLQCVSRMVHKTFESAAVLADVVMGYVGDEDDEALIGEALAAAAKGDLAFLQLTDDAFWNRVFGSFQKQNAFLWALAQGYHNRIKHLPSKQLKRFRQWRTQVLLACKALDKSLMAAFMFVLTSNLECIGSHFLSLRLEHMPRSLVTNHTAWHTDMANKRTFALCQRLLFFLINGCGCAARDLAGMMHASATLCDYLADIWRIVFYGLAAAGRRDLVDEMLAFLATIVDTKQLDALATAALDTDFAGSFGDLTSPFYLQPLVPFQPLSFGSRWRTIEFYLSPAANVVCYGDDCRFFVSADGRLVSVCDPALLSVYILRDHGSRTQMIKFKCRVPVERGDVFVAMRAPSKPLPWFLEPLPNGHAERMAFLIDHSEEVFFMAMVLTRPGKGLSLSS